MKLMFSGAAHEVTGSCHYLEAVGVKLLVDCGMEQGVDYYVNQEIPVPFSELDYILLTHAHVDHSGMIPFAYARGFRGAVLCTEATKELCDIMLRDSAHIQEFEAEWKNRKAKRAGKPDVEPVYTMNDAIGSIELFCGYPYNEKIEVCEGLEIRFTDVGHLLGSSSIEIWLTENEITKKLVFSGDIGNTNQPILKNPEYTKEADYVIMESTYGDRLHGDHPDYVEELARVIQYTLDRGGNLVIPSFAVGRTQQLLYYIRQIKEQKMVKGHGQFPVYVDSPLAIEATSIFNKNVISCFDEEAMSLIMSGINPLSFEGLKLSITSDQSKEINFDRKPKVIISASGMCEAGRIRHHLKHNLWKKESTILFIGYQARNTLGRSLLEGAKEVKLFGESIQVRAEIRRLEGMSGHADRNGLLQWIQAFEKRPEAVFVVHGEDTVCDLFADTLKNETGLCAYAPYSGAEYDLLAGKWIKEGEKIRIEKAEIVTLKHSSGVYARLVAAGQRLLTVIRHNEGGANKDLAKFADQINSLCDKWDR
jgi:metallo-beta-lactamase family protein